MVQTAGPENPPSGCATGAPTRTRNQDICRRRSEGESPRQIARDMHLSANIVSGVLYRAGLTQAGGMKSLSRRGKGKLSAEWVSYFRTNHTPFHPTFGTGPMSRLAGVTRSTVAKVLRREIWAHIP